MTRLQLETEVYAIMNLVGVDGTTINASAAMRTYVQNKIQSAQDTIWSKVRAQFRRKQFGLLLKAPETTGTLNFTKLAYTAVVTGVTPDSTWVGGHVVISGNGFPLRVASVSGSTLTFTEAIQATTNATSTYTMYFDGVMLPVDCQGIEEGTMKLAGFGTLANVPKERIDRQMGYSGAAGTDYGFSGGSFPSGDSVITTPVVGQPNVYASWGNVTASSIVRRIINVYPYPNANYSLSFDGFLKPTTLSADGDVSSIPEQFHLTVLLPRLKLDMCEFPGFELTSSEKEILNAVYRENLENMMDDDKQDTGEEQPLYPSALCR